MSYQRAQWKDLPQTRNEEGGIEAVILHEHRLRRRKGSRRTDYPFVVLLMTCSVFEKEKNAKRRG